MEINNPKHKSKTINNWKQKGVIYHDLEEIYEIYIKTMNCTHCKKEFKNTRDRHLDHCHETGLFRKIVCRSCNVHDCYLRFPDGTPSKQEREKIINKKWKDKNKEKIKIYQTENRDKINENQRRRRKEETREMKDKINERRRELRKEKKQLGLI